MIKSMYFFYIYYFKNYLIKKIRNILFDMVKVNVCGEKCCVEIFWNW